MSEPVATLISSTGDSVTVHGPGGTDTVLPVAVWQLPDARQVVVVGEGGPLIVADIDGAQLAEAIQSRWPGATMLERRTRPMASTGDPRAYDAVYCQLALDGSRCDPNYAELSAAGLHLAHA
ncbi:hypothetical protein FND50_18855 [Rhodococcus sp. WB9]|uniref:hypothetical protein n=1 Tax=Rhodococcus sp. WB9 TaxID=2594007 RepID=UPI00118658CF|nr:hypothetical protein [Rhodococcus sp. WB9]QDQ92651.1 hypothetical protein FND50_18855 [Rhodococcus sp. WB9]